MKNETKILVGAIIVILLLLVGAYALSGSSPQPSATPTVSPVSVTPTPTPTAEPTATATATVTATPVPSVTPTPEPESGVKQTEFGYWITYPPLGPQNWSAFKPYPSEPANNNIVYFDPTSGTMSLNVEAGSLDYYYSDYIQTTVYREGDMSGTVNVTIHADMSQYIVNEPYLTDVDSNLIRIDYIFSMHDKNYENLTGPDENGNYILTFGPGVDELELCLHIESGYNNDAEAQAPVESPEMPEGQVTLTITNADGGFVPGAQNQYMLNLAYVSEVRFGTYTEQMYYGKIYAIEEEFSAAQDFGIGYGGYIKSIADNGTYVDVFVPVARQFDTGELTVYFDWEDEMEDFAPGEILVAPYTFPDGEHNGLAKVSIPKQYVLDGTDNGLRIYFTEGDYYPIYPDDFDIYINDYAV